MTCLQPLRNDLLSGNCWSFYQPPRLLNVRGCEPIHFLLHAFFMIAVRCTGATSSELKSVFGAVDSFITPTSGGLLFSQQDSHLQSSKIHHLNRAQWSLYFLINTIALLDFAVRRLAMWRHLTCRTARPSPSASRGTSRALCSSYPTYMCAHPAPTTLHLFFGCWPK